MASEVRMLEAGWGGAMGRYFGESYGGSDGENARQEMSAEWCNLRARWRCLFHVQIVVGDGVGAGFGIRRTGDVSCRLRMGWVKMGE